MSTDNIENLAAARARKKKDAPPADDGPDERPVIRIHPGKIHETVKQAAAALAAFDDSLYTRGPFIVRPTWDKVKLSDGSSCEALRLLPVTSAHIVERMTAAARWEKYDKRAEDWLHCNCPTNVAEMYLAWGQWDLPYIQGIITAPTLRSDGSILDQEGYDTRTGILYTAMGVTFPRIEPNPTREDALAALDFLKGPLRLFPFSSPEHASVAVSAILSALVRRSLPTAPLHAFSATAAGSGKSMLVDIASMIAEGRPASVMSLNSGNPEEMEKRLGAGMIAGDSIISIDNIEGPLSSDLLCQLLTQTRVKIRILGKSERVDIPVTCSFFANGNNLIIVGDLTRRGLVSVISVDQEMPELRSFPFDPLQMVKDQRPEYVKAALTIMRAYIVTDDKVSVGTFGSFEAWSRMVREALIWLGEADPVEVVKGVRNSDPRLQQMRSMTSAWAAVFGNREILIRDVIAAAMENDSEHGGDARYPDLREALMEVCPDGKFLSPRKLTWWLRKNAGRVVNGMRFSITEHEHPQWKLLGAKANDPEARDERPVPPPHEDIPF